MIIKHAIFDEPPKINVVKGGSEDHANHET